MRKRWSKLGSETPVVLVLALLCALFFWRILTPFPGDRAYFPSGDFSDQFYGFGVFEARQLLTGRLPLWNPYALGGHPFLADVQSAVLYPPSLITILLSAPWRFPIQALEFEAIGHFFLAGLFTYLFASRLLKRRFPALVAAVSFTYGGYLTSYPVQQLAILEVDIWLPLILLLLRIASERWRERGEKRWAVWAGLVFGVSLLGGHPQSSMYVFYVALAYWAFETHRQGDLRARAGLFAVFVLTGLGLAAGQLIPSVEYMLLSTRAQGTFTEMAHGLPLHDWLNLILPGVLSQWAPLYVGVLPSLLAVLAIYLVRDRWVIFWTVLAAVALILTLGGSTFLYTAFYLLIPGFALFRSQERVAFVFSFAMAMLAGYGASQLFYSIPESSRRRLRTFNWGVVSAAAASCVLVFGFLYGWLKAGLAVDSPFGPMLNRAILLSLFMVLGAFCIYLRQRNLVGTSPLVLVCSLVIIFDLFTVNLDNNLQSSSPQMEYGPRALLAPVQADDDIFRVYNDWRLPANYGMVYQVQDIGGASPLRLRAYDELAASVPPERLWQLLNVKYVITAHRSLLPMTDIVYQESTGEDTTYLHRLREYSPRAYVVHQTQVLQGAAALELLADPTFDPLSMVVLNDDVDLQVMQEPPLPNSSVTISEYAPTRITLQVDSPADGMLVLSEMYYPGWRAYIDGVETKIYRADYALRAVRVERGSHWIEFVYDPISLKVGLLLTVVVLGLSAGVSVLTTVGRRARRVA